MYPVPEDPLSDGVDAPLIQDMLRIQGFEYGAATVSRFWGNRNMANLKEMFNWWRPDRLNSGWESQNSEGDDSNYESVGL